MSSRRAFMRGASVLMGHAALGQVITVFAAEPRRANYFNERDMRTLQALVDVILPATDSPAASAAGTHRFIDLAIPACATDVAKKTFGAGLAALSAKKFATAGAAKQVQMLRAQAETDMELPYEKSFFKILKDYTLTGYFLSETGATQALAYEKIPGGFQGDIPLTPDQKAWAI